VNIDPQDHEVDADVRHSVCTVADSTDQGGGRRRLLFGGMATALAAIATACSSDGDSSRSTSTGGSTQSAPAPSTGTGSESGSSSPPASAGSDSTTAPTDNADTTAAPDATDTTAAPGDDGAASETEASEGGDDGATSDGKNQEADVPVREGDVDGGRDPNNPTAKELSAELAKDLGTVSFAAGLEFLAVDSYRRTALAAAAGSLGAVPPAVGEFVVTVMGHHQAALDELNRVLLLSGEAAVDSPNAELRPIVDDGLADATDVESASRLALMLEEIAAATYLAAIPTLISPEAIAFAASVYPIDMQHASVLRFVLGEYPVPDVFGKVEKAASPV
jgi:hypothetical protein